MKLMRLLRKRFTAFGNKGFSLVELICTMAIVSVVDTAVSGMLVVTGDSYQRGTNETQLQQEAQLVANQINDLLIDAPSGVNFSGGVLTITRGSGEYKVSYNATNKTLLNTESGTTQVLARNVEGFSVDTSTYDDYGYAKMDLRLSKEGRVYPAVFTMSARNKDMTSTVAPIYYLDTLGERIMEPNCNKQFTATLLGAPAYDLEWSLNSTPTDPDTKFTDDNLSIGRNENANQVMAKVVAKNPTSGDTFADRYVQVKVRRANAVAIDAGPELLDGDDKKAGAKYRFTAIVSGNNLERHSTESATDYAEVDPYAIKWTHSGPSGLVGTVWESIDATDTRRRVYVIQLAHDMVTGETLTVKATSKHATGSNKSNVAYNNNVYDEKEILGPDPVIPPAGPADPYIIPGAGWMRMSNQDQGVIDDSIHTLKQSLKDNIPGVVGDLKHRVLIKYREYPGGTYQSNWLPNIYGDADNSMKINLRPLVTGAFDYREDYEVMLKLSIIDDTGKEIWPLAGVTHDSEYLLVQIMPRVGVTFKSDLLGFAETQKVEEAVAPVLSGARRDQQYQIMEKVSQVGIDLSGNAFENNLRFEIDKKDGSGYSSVTEGIEIQNNQGKCMITFRNDQYEGLYRIRVQAINMEKNKLNPDGTLTNNGTETYHLSNTVDGHNIFYFRVTK